MPLCPRLWAPLSPRAPQVYGGLEGSISRGAGPGADTCATMVHQGRPSADIPLQSIHDYKRRNNVIPPQPTTICGGRFLIFLIVSVIIFINIYIRPASIITIIRAASVFIMLSLISAATGFRQPGYRHLVQPVPLRKIPWLAAAWGSTGHGDGGGCVGVAMAGGALVEG